MSRYFIIVYAFSILLYSSCAKRQDAGIQPPPSSDSSSTSGSDSTFYYSFSLDGVAYSAAGTMTSNGYHTGDSGVSYYVDAAILPPGVQINSGFSILDTTEFQEVIGNLILDGMLTAFYDSLRPRSLHYGTSAGGGVIIVWVDRQDVLWSSMLGSGDQTGSNFSITASNYDKIDVEFIDVSASFNCKLYDSAGNVKTLMNGHTRLPFFGP